MFEGFDVPKQNWCKVPCDFLDDVDTIAEAKILFYVLRHTWGFSEYGKPKRITLDEFQKGRKKTDGTRMDNGTGLSHQSVITGIKKAIEHGKLLVETNGSDRGRMKKLYYLRMKEGSKPLTPDVKKSDPGSQEFRGRTEKETLDRKKGLSSQRLDGTDGANGRSKVSDTDLTTFDRKAASRFHEVVSSHIKVNCKANMTEWAHQFRKMRQVDEVPKKVIREAIEWYSVHIGGDYIPEAFSAKTFREKYRSGQIKAAIDRTSTDVKPKKEIRTDRKGRQFDRRLLSDLFGDYCNRYGGGADVRVSQEKLDVILVERGMKPGSVPWSAI
jgi:hypothetical protein